MAIVERLCKTQIVPFGLENLYNQPQPIKTRESNRLKYCSGSGSRNLIFNGSGSRLFKNLGSGSVSVAPKFKDSDQVHRFKILKVWVRFRFNDLKFKRFRFIEKKKTVFTGSRFSFGFRSTP